MSRSYKKNEICTDRSNGAKFWKRISNKKVRKSRDSFQKSSKYKRIYNSYEIHDYISRWSKKQALNDYHYSGFFYKGEWIPIFKEYKTEKDFLNKYWKKIYYRK